MELPHYCSSDNFLQHKTKKDSKEVNNIIIQSNISASDASKQTFSLKENVLLFLKALIKMFAQHTQLCAEERHILQKREGI